MNVIARELERQFEPIEPMEFYREIFPAGSLENAGEYVEGKYNAIALEITKQKRDDGRQLVRRYTVTDELDAIDELLWSQNKNFCLIAPISYAGKTRESKNARFMYALCVEIDNLIVKNGKQEGLMNLIWQWRETAHVLPRPTYVVASGNGVHLYYVLDYPLPLFRNVVKALQVYKRRLTTLLWNRYITTDYKPENVQQESVFQAFRMVGSITKAGDRVQAFRTGERVNIEYLNSFVADRYKMLPTAEYTSSMSLKTAAERYPEWYQRRIIEGKPRKTWVCKRDLYDWWLRRISSEVTVGHRYYSMMMLCIYAIKSGISHDELEKDCFELMSHFDSMTPEGSNNSFTSKDVMDALQAFEDRGLVTYPISSISKLSGLYIEKNKRNYRKQANHLKLARGIKNIKAEMGEDVAGGRPKGSGTAEKVVLEWQKDNPGRRKADCVRETGLDKKTVYKWWKNE